MHSFISSVRTKCGSSIPRRPRQRGSDDIMPIWASAAPMHRALEKLSVPGSAVLGSILSPPCTHQLKCQCLSANNGHLWSKLFQQYKDSEFIFQHRSRGGGREAKQCTVTLSFKQESLPGSRKYFKALSKIHWNQQRPFPFISVDTGEGCTLRHNLKALSVTLSCIMNNTTNPRKGTEIPASSYTVTLS